MKEELKKLGLSGKETEVYLAILKAGSASVSRIHELSGIPRPTIYDVSHSLINRGLISTYNKDNKQYFDAVSPKVFLDEIKNKEKIIRDLIPKLDSISKTFIKKPTLEVYEKFKGIQSLLNEIYEEKEILLYGSAEISMNALGHLPENLAKKRVKEKIKLKAIFEFAPEATFRLEDPEVRSLTEMRFLEVLKEVPSVTFIAGNKIAIITLEKELIGVKIEDDSINKTQRILFETLWSIAKKRKK